MTEASTVLY